MQETRRALFKIGRADCKRSVEQRGEFQGHVVDHAGTVLNSEPTFYRDRYQQNAGVPLLSQSFLDSDATVKSVFSVLASLSPSFALLLSFSFSSSFLSFVLNRKQQRNRKKCSTLKEVVAPWISRSGCTKSTMDPKTWSVKMHTGLHVLEHHGWASFRDLPVRAVQTTRALVTAVFWHRERMLTCTQ